MIATFSSEAAVEEIVKDFLGTHNFEKTTEAEIASVVQKKINSYALTGALDFMQDLAIINDIYTTSYIKIQQALWDAELPEDFYAARPVKKETPAFAVEAIEEIVQDFLFTHKGTKFSEAEIAETLQKGLNYYALMGRLDFTKDLMTINYIYNQVCTKIMYILLDD